METEPCPCQSGLAYDACCQPYHLGQIAPTALALMRSRYSAYAMVQLNYLMDTTHRDNAQYQKNTRVWRNQLANYCKTVSFLGLKILAHEPEENNATVTFEAQLSQNDRPFILHEKSNFVKLGRRWLYHSGDTRLSD